MRGGLLAEVDRAAVGAGADAQEAVGGAHPVHHLRLAGEQGEQGAVGLRALLQLRRLDRGEQRDVGVLDVERAGREALGLGRDRCRLRRPAATARRAVRRPGPRRAPRRCRRRASAAGGSAAPSSGPLLGRALLGVDRSRLASRKSRSVLVTSSGRASATSRPEASRVPGPQRGRLPPVGVPLGRGHGEPALDRPARRVLDEPPVQPWPLPEQRLVRDLDRPVGDGQQAGAGEVLDDGADPAVRQGLELAERHPPSGDRRAVAGAGQAQEQRARSRPAAPASARRTPPRPAWRSPR